MLGIPQQEVVSECFITIIGGSDTSATAIRAIMMLVMTNPKVYNKLQKEIDDAVEKGSISSPVIKDTEAKELPYLQAVIREGLRLYPPATGNQPKVVPPEGDYLNGVFIPGGTIIGINLFPMLRTPDNFGPDSEIFNPDRWIDATPERKKEMEYVAELLWSYGKSKCLGQPIALMELGKVIFEVGDFNFTDR